MTCLKMFLFIHILLSIQIIFVQSINYQKPVAQKIWSERCKKNEHVLNDCNWCWCGQNHRFQCKARVCEEVDMFGHFKDTIQEINVGMEGHGAWRSRPTSCAPGVQYQRGTVLCICDEDGNWPNPVCRDFLRILHAVEVTEKLEESTSQSCSPSKLYLVGCNTCFCPSSGKFDANLCTNRTCSDGDPVLEPKDDVAFSDDREEIQGADEKTIDDNVEAIDRTHTDSVVATDNDMEVYATCNTKKVYSIGHQECECLVNNRLICKDYISRGSNTDLKSRRSLCSGRLGVTIKNRCNLCKCVTNNKMYCTLKHCRPRNKRLKQVFRKVPRVEKIVEAPVDDLDCIPGTTYKRGCNSCFCKIEKGQKVFGCTVKACHPGDDMVNMARDCVAKTTYETDCFLCSCDVIDGEKYQVCSISSRCQQLIFKDNNTTSLDTLHGSCEPRRLYTHGCNKCRCIDGRIVSCTTRPCVTRTTEPGSGLEVEIVPFKQAVRETCPKGHSYKVECNLCFCLSDGNALCTSADCSKPLDY